MIKRLRHHYDMMSFLMFAAYKKKLILSNIKMYLNVLDVDFLGIIKFVKCS
jgi:hypothetical protein